MRKHGVPEDTQARLMGGNARRMYGIEEKNFVSQEPGPIDRPDWFPQGPELERWADIVAHPRQHEDEREGVIIGETVPRWPRSRWPETAATERLRRSY